MAHKVLFSAVKNEAPFLLEWIAYHRAIGFDRFLIVSNDSDDGTTELLDALHSHGIVHHIHHSVGPDESPQGKAALAANASGVISDGDWVIWLDADEFLNIHAGAGKVDDLIAAMGDAQGMVIPWRIFGDSGNAMFPGRFISPDFTRAAEREDNANKLVKTFYRHQGDRVRLSAITNHRPHLHNPKAYRITDFKDAGGQPLDREHRPNRRWLKGVEGKANFSIPETNYRWDFAQINHYMLRTREMFDLKAYRGRGYVNIVKGKPVHRSRHTPEFYSRNNKNEAEDRSILRHVTETERELSLLMASDEVRIAHESGLCRTAERLRAMADQGVSVADPGIAPTEPLQSGPPIISMPDAEADLVSALYAQHDVILEYGTGGSTRLAASQAHSLIMGVESDPAWASDLEAGIRRDFPQANLRMHWADIGPTGKWGQPRDEAAWRKFHLYPLSVWDQPWFRHPDLVLVDGRFRIGCLLATLFRITRPVTVLFDDYADRPQYAEVVESFVRPVSMTGRMARFALQPMPLPVERLAEITGLMSLPD